MKEQLRIEFSRCIRSKMLWMSFAIGMAIVIAQVIFEVYPAACNPLKYYHGGFSEYPFSVFQKWIGQNSASAYSLTYRILLPVLATLPYGLSYHMDRKTGYIKNVYIRTRKEYYLTAKYIVTFLSAGVVVIVPYLINLLITACLLPSLIPVKNGMFPIRGICMMQDLYYKSPYLYIAVYMLLYFIYAGVFASVALAATRFIENIFLLSLTPFIIYYGLGMMSPLFRNVRWLHVISPTKLLNLCQSSAVTGQAVVGVVLLIGILSLVLFFRSAGREDVF